MTDKELIKQEIERRINISLAQGYTYSAAQLKRIFDFIGSLPEESGCEANFTTKSEDLDFLVISLEETIGTSPHSREVIKKHLQKAAEWQKQQMKEALQTEYEKGRFDMREEMMKDVVDGEYWDGSIYLDNRPTEYKDGDKVKIIIVKEN